MKTIAEELLPSRTHERRSYHLTPVWSETADAYLVIRQGEVGPRGGVSRLDVNAYDLQEVPYDPEEPAFVLPDPDRPGSFYLPEPDRRPRVFLLAKDNPEDPAVYAVRIVPGFSLHTGSQCTCTGWNTTKGCKHSETLWHLVNVKRWTNVSARLATTYIDQLHRGCGGHAPDLRPRCPQPAGT